MAIANAIKILVTTVESKTARKTLILVSILKIGKKKSNVKKKINLLEEIEIEVKKIKTWAKVIRIRRRIKI